MNKTLHILTILLLLFGAGPVAFAQGGGDPEPAAETPKRPRVMILGNVYGGGELAQVVAPDAATAKAQLIQDADLATLFTNADHIYTTYVHLGDSSEVYGRVFGGGKGQHDALGESAGRVTGQTDVALDGATVWSEIYGGGEMADVRGNTLLHFKKGKAGHNAFGGGLGKLGKRDNEDHLVELGPEDNLPDNRYEPLASADIKQITEWNVDKITGESFVVFDGTEVDGVAIYTHYEFEKARTVNRDANGMPVKVDGKYYTETDQFQPNKPEQLFSINHNIYGGGMTASQVEGKTFVHINYGMVNQDMMEFEHDGQKVWSTVYNSIANAQFCVFGGGYGYYTDILGDTNVTMDVEGSGNHTYLRAFRQYINDNWKEDLSHEQALAIAEAAPYTHGASQRSCMDIVGGGYNGKVHGSTNVKVSGDVVLRKVYGGGYYSSVGNANVHIKSGIFNRVYGGGLIGNVYGKATMTIGQKQDGESEADRRKQYVANMTLVIKDAVYGGNDVSGTVGTTAPGAHTQTNPDNHVTYNVFYPVDDPDHGVRLNIYGGLVLGDVYGAGNGNHPGYGNPNYMQFGYSQHPSENYRKVIEEGQLAVTNDHYGHVYKYRPRTGRVVVNIAGNEGANFNDAITVDKVRIWGRTFGGGNSCNVGIWNGKMDDIRENYSDVDWDFGKTEEQNKSANAAWHPGDNYLGGGSIYMNIGSHVQLGNRNDSHETPNGLFMGSNGEHMITQHTDIEQAKYYHQYYDLDTKKYWPGFPVYQDGSAAHISREAGRRSFKAFINTITTKSDNVNLNIKNFDDTAAEDIWMSNFVGGGYRGSMQATTEDGVFKYTLPEGVTVGHAIVGGAFNAHVIYRIYATTDGHNYETTTDGKGNTVYRYEYDLSKAGTKGTDYRDTITEVGPTGTDETHFIRYNFDGGMLAHDSEMSADEGSHSRIHQVHPNPNEPGITAQERADRFATSYFEPLTEGDGMEDEATKAQLFTKNKDKALVHLNLRCALHPMVHDTYDPILKTDHTVHGGVVYGGCYATGFIEGDTWVDYGCWLSPLCSGSEYFDKNDNMAIYGDVANLDHVSAMMVFGAGYGADTHSMGDVYVYIKSIADAGDAGGEDDKFGQFPYIYNAFGGGNMGTVAGNTNVYYAAGVQGTLLGSLYGGGYKGRIDGNTFVELAEGFVTNCYGGSRQADIGGAAHVWAYDGKYRGVPDAKHLIICNLYGGNDVAGTIGGIMPATWAANKWETSVTDYCESIQGREFSTYVEISSDDNSANRGFPLIGSVFAGGNGAYDYTSETIDEKPNPYYGWDVPTVAKTLLEIDGGSTLRAFGGGNNATVTESAHILTDAHSTKFAEVTFAEYQKNIMQKVFFNGQLSGYKWEGTKLMMNDTHIFRLFGGNNLADMAIQPVWNLQDGHIENVYSGGNMGNMTYYNPAGVEARTDIAPNTTPDGKTTLLGVENTDGTNINGNPKGLSITINSPTIRIGSLFGGCRMSDVKANDDAYDNANKWPDFEHGGEDCYGATVNVIDGNIGYIFGGNDVSGKVVHGTNINICGGVIGQVYGSGNGDFLYKYIPADARTNSAYGDTYKTEANDTRITEHLDDEHGLYYTVPENDENGTAWDASSTGDTHKIMTINKVRPSVDNTFINIAGLAPEYNDGVKRITLIKGNVYMGGNATTVSRNQEDIFTKFKYGSYAVAGGLYMGSDGYSYTQDETISKFALLNGISNMGASTQFNSGHEDDARHNPILLNAYLTAVDMNALPKEFATTTDLKETYVGTICGGGNRGSMLMDETVNLVIPAQITVFDKVVAGCNDATINYNQNGTTIKSVGGYTRPIEDRATYGNTKIRYNIAAQFVPLTLDVPMGTDLKVPVNRTDENNHKETWADAIQHAFLWPRLNSTEDAYTSGCNIYGGCYSSGEMEGDVELNIYSNMLRYANETKLQKAIANGEACFNVFGAGFGQDSHVWGNVHIKMDKPQSSSPIYSRLVQEETSPVGDELLTNPKYLGDKSDITTYDTPSVNNIFGGGRNGQLIGNTTLEVRNGRVYTDVVGGCYASNMYGSSQVIVGYPVYYECQTSGEYSLQRGDQWNTTQSAIKRSVRYLKGDLVPQNVYDQITDGSKSTKFTRLAPAPADWSAVNIQIGKGVYGGGYSLANSTSASAGSVTTNKLRSDAIEGALHPMNFNGRFYIDDVASTVGYGGNSAIMVGDVAGAGSGDHIQISALNDGGIYGDGHLTFCEGFRAADLTGYGYNTASPKRPRLLNTFQRLDLLDVNDCCLELQGAQDFAANQIDATTYSLTRIDELRMNSTISAEGNLTALSETTGTESTGFSTSKVRNYIGFNNLVHYLGALVTNDSFAADGATYHSASGTKGVASYYNIKKTFIDDYSPANPQAFKARNMGTARNCIGLNSGYCLRVQNLGDNGLYYGPIVGVAEVKLLTLSQGEGGGYVYADNIHDDDNNFLNTSGNFVFPGAVGQGDDIADQYIVDDCFMNKFGTPEAITTKNGALDEAHYWYVEGNKYFYNTTLTGYTYKSPPTMEFNLTDNDPNVVLSGIENGSSLNIKKIEWLSTHRGDYRCVLENSTPNKVDDYEFDIEVGSMSKDDSKWTNDMTRYTAGDNANPLTTGKTFDTSDTPIFNIRLQDKKDNSGDENYNNHLDEPEKVKIYLEGETKGQKYEYTITLNIVYLQGPTYEGGVDILNCALPGERIGFSSGGIKIKTPDLMPITETAWEILPLDEIDADGNWKWDTENGVEIPASQYSEDLTGNLTGSIPALYKQNESNIAYIFTAGGHKFPVMPSQDATLKQYRMIVVHNYHRMKDIVAQGIEESVTAGACVYLQDEDDLTKFVEWVNAGKLTEGVNFILQDSIRLTKPLTALSQSFAGTFHGDGYHINLGTHASSLFDSLLTGKVYNLGLIGGTIATTGTRTNCYEGTALSLQETEYKYGKTAYALSHYFTPTHEGASTVTDANNYVKNRYANGDYQYATTDRVWSLRTGEPWYGHEKTRHDISHTHDADRWVDTDDDDDENDDILSHTGYNEPLYDGTKVIANKEIHDPISDDVTGTLLGIPASYANDYLFFGQHLDKDNADLYPVHISSVASGDADASKGGNRVYKSSGYYQSGTDGGFHYNRDAWALQPTLTAVDYTRCIAEGDNASTMPAKFSVDSNADYNTDGTARGTADYDNAAYGHVSQNLLVYCNGESIFSYRDTQDSNEADVLYHNIVKGQDDKFATDYLHLVDKQDFNAPIEFTVNQRAWYERLPQNYRTVTQGYDNPSAWEGICLPFTVSQVSGEEEGNVLSHFYGIPTESMLADPATNDRTLHHEYWLAGFVGTNVENDKTMASFKRPGGEGETTGIFDNSHMRGDYNYENTYYRTLDGYVGYVSDRDNESSWYELAHTFSNYPYIAQNTPYVVAFPGEGFYEFDLTNQVVTLETGETTIGISDDQARASIVNGYGHVGTYLHVPASGSVYGMDDTGAGFETRREVLPFRTYMTTTTAPTRRYIAISSAKDSIPHEEADEPEDELLEQEDDGPRYDLQGRRIGQHNAQGIQVSRHRKVLVR